MNYFKAAVLEELNKELVLHDLHHTSPKEGQVKVKLLYSGICGAQINEIKGIKGPDKFLPHLMGHEGVGEIVEIGPKVKFLTKGDYVILHWRKSAGIDTLGGEYKSKQGKKIASGPVTTFAEYTIVSENRLSKINYDKNLDHVYPLLGCALSTSYGIVLKETHPNENDSILISGGGGLGLSILYWLKTIFPKIKITILEKNFKKLDYLKNFLEITIIDSIDLDNNDFKYDYVYETTGNIGIISSSFDLLSKNGHLLLIGQPKVNSNLTIKNPLAFFDGRKISASDGGQIDYVEDLPKILKKINLELFNKLDLISKIIKLEDINLAIQEIQKGIAKRILIKF